MRLMALLTLALLAGCMTTEQVATPPEQTASVADISCPTPALPELTAANRSLTGFGIASEARTPLAAYEVRLKAADQLIDETFAFACISTVDGSDLKDCFKRIDDLTLKSLADTIDKGVHFMEQFIEQAELGNWVRADQMFQTSTGLFGGVNEVLERHRRDAFVHGDEPR